MAPKAKVVKFKCGYCPDSCSGKKSLKCSLCDQWHHQECIEGMSAEFFSYLDEQIKKGTFTWYCEKCAVITKKVLNQMTDLTTRVEKLEEHHEANLAQWGKNETKVTEMERRLKKLEDNEKEGTSASDVFGEFRERDNRRDNLIVHGLEEAGETIKEGKERAEADMKKVQELADVIGVEIVVKEAIKFSRRVGEKKDDQPRPLQIGFKKNGDKSRIMDKASRLSEKEDPWKNVNIGHDLTTLQRKEEAKLMEEADKKNAEMSDDEKTKNGTFLVVGRRGERRMIRTKQEVGERRTRRTGRQ